MRAKTRKQGGRWSVAVIGAGVVGLATARALLDRGIEVDIFEPGAPGGAQSRGRSRLYLRAIGDPRVRRLVDESVAIWNRWQEETGTVLLSPHGVISFGELAVARGSAVREELSGDDLRDLTEAEARKLLPQLARPAGPATLDTGAGTIWARLAVSALLGWSGDLIIPRRADGLEPLADGRVRVHAGDISRTYDAVVVAAGLESGPLVADLGVEIPMERRARVLTTHSLVPELVGRELPGFRGLEAGGEMTYGMPVRTGDLYEIGFYRDLRTDGNGRIVPEAVRQMAGKIEGWVREMVPGLGPDRMATFSDWVIELPWGMDAVGIWRAGPVLVPAGMRLFALAPILGEVLAEAAEGRPVRSDFRPDQLLGDPRAGF